MTDITQLSDDELASLAGSQPKADITKVSDSDLRAALKGAPSTGTWGDAVSGAISRLPSQVGHATVDAVTALPLMAEDFGVGLRNLYGKVTGGQSDFEYPSDTVHKAEDAVFGAPQTTGEKVGNALSAISLGGNLSAANQVPAAVRTALVAAPEAGEAAGGLAGAPVRVSPDFVSPAQAKAQQLAATLKKAQDAGYVVPPATSNPNPLNQAVETIGSKVGTQQHAALRNSDTVTKGVMEDLGLNSDAPLTLGAIRAVKAEAGKGWDAVRNMGSIEKDQQFTDNLRQMRAELQASGEIGAEPSPLIKEIDRMLGDKTIANSGLTPTIPGNPLASSSSPTLSAVRPGASSNVALDPVTLKPVQVQRGSSVMNVPAQAPVPGAGGVTAGGDSTLDPLTLAVRRANNNAALFPGASATGASRSAGSAGSNANLDPLTLTSRPSTFSADQALRRNTELRDLKDSAFRNGNGGLGRGYGQLSQELENLVERNAAGRAAAGDKTITPDVVQNLRASRALYAKARTAEDAFDEGTGKISLQKLGQMYDRGEPLSGNMQLAGQFANSYKKAAQDPTKIGSAGVNHLEGGLMGALSTGGALLGHEHGGALGTAVGLGAGLAIPAARRAAMAYALSKAGQSGGLPNVVAATASPGKAAAIAQALQASKERNRPVALEPAPAY